MKITIFFGSKPGTDVMKGAADCLREFGIEFKACILSAHRVPEKLTETLKKAEESGCEVAIAGAGLVAHLPDVIASQTAMPVIGVSIKGAVEGLDALFSIVRMPKSVPVATVGTNNSYNAGMLAVQMLAIKDSSLREKLNKLRLNMESKFIEENGGGAEL